MAFSHFFSGYCCNMHCLFSANRGKMSNVIHIHSGDSAARTAQTAVAGKHLAFSDLLMVGPIPPIKGLSWLDDFVQMRSKVLYEELSVERYSLKGIQDKLHGELQTINEALMNADAVYLWFDHCLFDQMLLHFMITAFLQSLPCPVFQVPCPKATLGFGELSADKMINCMNEAKQLPNNALNESATTIWPAFTSTLLSDIVKLSQMRFADFPDTPAAAQRLLEELPMEHNGLNRLEFAILSTVLDGHSQFIDIFREVSAREQYPFYGDTYVRKRIDVLASGPSPLLRILPNGSIIATLQGARSLWGWGNWRQLNPGRRYIANICIDS